VIVVPDGPLGLVPFDALLVYGTPLGATRTVRSVPAAAALLAPAVPPVWWQMPWTTTLAAFGDPLPGRDAWTAAPGRLPASAEEVRAIDTTLGGAHAIFLGADNRKAHLAGALSGHPAVLHIATHGMADPAAAERSRLVFSPASADGPAESLFLREVYDLPLDGVALAVLSACDTERGPLVRGEGIEGFSRALMAAGARSTVTTLWRVPDAATAQLMAIFYDRLQAGESRADALAAAKRALQQSAALSHPHYWAAFVLTGEDGPLPRAPRWSTLLGTGLLVIGGGLALLAVRSRRRAG
jgi:CHAT domain-containing protein